MQEGSSEFHEARDSITAAAERQLPSLSRLLAAQYDSLLGVAEQLFAAESPANSLSPGSLVHEAYLRLIDQPKVTSRGSIFFRACFAQECRRILVNRARRRRTLKRGGQAARESLADQKELGIELDVDLVELDAAMRELAQVDLPLHRIVELRYFGGLTVAECATALGVSKRTVDTKWAFARAWLRKRLSD